MHVLDERRTADAKSVHVRHAEIELESELLFPRAPLETALLECGVALADVVHLERAQVLTRYFLPGGASLDWSSDPKTNEQTLGRLLGPDVAEAYRTMLLGAREALRFVRDRVWNQDRPTLVEAVQIAFTEGPAFLRSAFAQRTLTAEAHKRFDDPIMHLVLERYARMLGSDPRKTPATVLALHAAEVEGTYAMRGGLRGLVQGLERSALRAGAVFHYNAKGIRVRQDEGQKLEVETDRQTFSPRAVVVATEGPVGGLRSPRFFAQGRSSASLVEWAFVGNVRGRPLARETVLPSYVPSEELDDLFVRSVMPSDPTLRLVQFDGHEDDPLPANGARRFVLSMLAPSDPRASTDEALEALEKRVFTRLHEAGLVSRMGAAVRLSPLDRMGMSPDAAYGAFGPNAHGLLAPLARASTVHEISGVFNATKRTHPGPLLSMQLAAGRRAANAALAFVSATT